ncbi:MAG: hypothetical protein LBT54_05300, partial [Bifidobacteriaceae bacterium]|nr:hypothetical protein [Bifidobacteriaceae bacterium]
DALAVPVLGHRLLPSVPTRGQDVSAQLAELVSGIVNSVPVPVLPAGAPAPPPHTTTANPRPPRCAWP